MQRSKPIMQIRIIHLRYFISMYKFEQSLKDMNLTEAALVQPSDLPPRDAYKMALDAGYSHRVIDLKSSALSFI